MKYHCVTSSRALYNYRSPVRACRGPRSRVSPSNEEGATGIDNSNSIEDSLPGVRVNPARQRYQPRLRRLVVGSGIPQTVEPEDAAVAPHVRPLAMLDRPGLGPRQGRDENLQ